MEEDHVVVLNGRLAFHVASLDGVIRNYTSMEDE